MANPDMSDFTDRFNTQLSPAEEAAFQKWSATLPRGQQSSYDYDLRGAWKAGAGQAANGHFPDTYKKPNHPTFSDQSQYSGVSGYTGGSWGGDDKKGWLYTPSQTNLQFHQPGDLLQYFKQVEPGSSVLLPQRTGQ